ncbi:MAG: DUF4388 domain-containing protein [candidate division Zixibacteria bacterium]|nr:DUF4388 domain-containing protein [candidate division Zixibacteria bacterium]
MSLSGNLKTVAFPDILQLLATGKKTGILECRTNTRQKEVAFKDGNITYASSVNSSEDLLGQMLLKRGRISKTDLERAILLHKQTGRQLGTTLMDMNLFEKQEVGECLKLQIEETVYNLFSWREGDFIFHEGASPKNAQFFIELSTMTVIMEGTRRIDEWLEIQKVLPPDESLLRLSSSPKTHSDEVVLTLDEFRMLALINGERTMTELIDHSSMGEFVTCRALYKLIVDNLVEVVGRRETVAEVHHEDEEEVILAVVFQLYSNCFFQIRSHVQEMFGEHNSGFSNFASQYRSGILNFFTGVDPQSDLMPPFEKFLTAVRTIPQAIRFYTVMSSLDRMLCEQLVFVYQTLGEGAFKNAVSDVKKEIADPLTLRRDAVKRFNLEDSFYTSIKRADKVVKLVRG